MSNIMGGRGAGWGQRQHFADWAQLLPIQEHDCLAASAQPACASPHISTLQVCRALVHWV